MITFNNKPLIRFQEKNAGKNNSSIDGFYKDSDGKQFFIKKPEDQGELFAELFAGLLINEFKTRQLIDEIYYPSLICADVIRLEDGSYGLIQPRVSFVELHKVIGTSNNNGNDRSAGVEAFFGPSYYATLTQQGQYFGLSMALMFSLLFGAHSVHSGNIVVLKENEHTLSKQFGRIDWGDAFRFFAHKDNNDDLLYAYETQGIFNIKQLTKNYFLNYKMIPGIYPAMAQKAGELQVQINDKVLLDIVMSALTKIPDDLINQKTKEEFSKYIFMDSFKNISFGPKGKFEEFAKEMAGLLSNRLGKITHLKDLHQQATPLNLYASSIELKPRTLKIQENSSFLDQLNDWAPIIKKKNESFDTSQLELEKLAAYFNEYINNLAEYCDSNNLWQHDGKTNDNMFTPFYKGNYSVEHGHAFVAQYKESTILRRLFSMDPKTLNLARFAPFEKPCRQYNLANKNSLWVKLENLLTLGQGVINTLKIIKVSQKFGIAETVKENIPLFKKHLHAFQKAEKEVQKLLAESYSLKQKNNADRSYFYSIDDAALGQMTGDQLATICLEELNSPVPTPLIERIISNHELWLLVDTSFKRSKEFKGRLDDVSKKIETLHQWHTLVKISTESHSKQVQTLEQEIKQSKQDKSSAIKSAQSAQDKLKQQIEENEQIKVNMLNKYNEKSKQHDLELQTTILVAEEKSKQLNQVIDMKKQDIVQLHQAVEQQKQVIETLEREKSQARESEKTLNLQLNEFKQASSHKVNDLNQELIKQQKEINNEQIISSTYKNQIELLQNNMKELNEKYQSALSLQSSLTLELEGLKNQLLQVKQQSSEQIANLMLEIKKQQQQLSETTVSLTKEKAKNAVLEKAEAALSQGKLADKQTISKANETFAKLNQQLVDLQKDLKTKEDTIAELKSKVQRNDSNTKSTQEITGLYHEALKQVEQNKLVQDKLIKEIDGLQVRLEEQNAELEKVQKINSDISHVQKEDETVAFNKTRYLARLEKMAPVLIQIQGIEKKAIELKERNELEASGAATAIANLIREDIIAFAESKEEEHQALNHFKTQADLHINQSEDGLNNKKYKEVLNTHRAEWKYILANLALAIVSIGVGYGVASLINKAINGNFTFFSVTKSGQQVAQLEDSILTQAF